MHTFFALVKGKKRNRTAHNRSDFKTPEASMPYITCK
jgi:hypothetical protein